MRIPSKFLSTVMYAVGIIIILIFGICGGNIGESISVIFNEDYRVPGVFLGLVIGFIVALFLFAFGNTISDLEDLVNLNKKTNEPISPSPKKHPQTNVDKQIKKINVEKSSIKDFNDFNHNDYIDMNCPHCNENLSFTSNEINSSNDCLCPYCNNKVTFK